MWLIILSDQLPVIALVSRYLTNKLMGREPFSRHEPEGPLSLLSLRRGSIWGINYPFE